ncbi:hypothetical protein ACWCOV_10850 [Kribbella sp. NPDC002412]
MPARRLALPGTVDSPAVPSSAEESFVLAGSLVLPGMRGLWCGTVPGTALSSAACGAAKVRVFLLERLLVRSDGNGSSDVPSSGHESLVLAGSLALLGALGSGSGALTDTALSAAACAAAEVRALFLVERLLVRSDGSDSSDVMSFGQGSSVRGRRRMLPTGRRRLEGDGASSSASSPADRGPVEVRR